MKRILQRFILSVSITAVHAQAQDAVVTTPVQPTNDQAPVLGVPDAAAVAAPAVVYDAPVVYNAPVIYQAPVVYNAPVTYSAATPVCAPAPVDCKPDCQSDCGPVSTVVYIGGGHVRYQYSDACSNSGSTVVCIGGSRR